MLIETIIAAVLALCALIRFLVHIFGSGKEVQVREAQDVSGAIYANGGLAPDWEKSVGHGVSEIVSGSQPLRSEIAFHAVILVGHDYRSADKLADHFCSRDILTGGWRRPATVGLRMVSGCSASTTVPW